MSKLDNNEIELKGLTKFFKEHVVIRYITLVIFILLGIFCIIDEIKEKNNRWTVNLQNIQGAGYVVYVQGTITNNQGNANYVQINIPIYDENNNKIGEALDTTSELRHRQTWKFNAVYMSGANNLYNIHCNQNDFRITSW